MPRAVIQVLCGFTVFLFDGVAGASPTCHLEEAWLLFYEEFAFLRHVLECLKRHPTSSCFSSMFCFCDCTKRQRETGAEIFPLGFGTSLLAPSLASLFESFSRES